jgi:hypothetical protein
MLAGGWKSWRGASARVYDGARMPSKRQVLSELSTTAAQEGVTLRGGWLQVSVAFDVPAPDRPARARRLLAGWYRRHAREKLPEIVTRWASKLDVDPTSVLVREAPKRWDSCDPRGNLRLNWRVIQAPPRLIEYVVAHELMHLRHEHHSAAFWATLGRVLPDYEARRADLRPVGAGLLW